MLAEALRATLSNSVAVPQQSQYPWIGMAYPINDKLDQLTELCRRYGVRKLALFGSALRDDFNPESSDLDFLVEFEPPPPGRYAKVYFGFLRELETLFDRRIDLIETGTIRNPYVRDTIEAEQETLYAA
jgi:predicted nucleotidyltransferase